METKSPARARKHTTPGKVRHNPRGIDRAFSMRKNRLTDKQKKYCKARAAGKGYADSYAEAGYAYRDDTIGRATAAHNADNMENRLPATTEKIRNEIRRLQEQAEQGAILDRKARQGLLTSIALDAEENTTDRLRAADMLNRMSGDYTDRVQVDAVAKLSFYDRLEAIQAAMEEDS